jgi:hypothetical protein
MNPSISNYPNPTPPPSLNGPSTDTPHRSGDPPLRNEAGIPGDMPEAPQTELEGICRVAVPWGHAKRILFRFAFVYLALWCAPFLLSMPALFFSWWPTILWQPYAEAHGAVVNWVAEQVFQVELSPRVGLRGDITADYITVFCNLVLAAVAAAVWSLLDRKRPNYVRLYAWLRVSVCFYLAAEMVLYGSIKVIPTQFGRLSPEQLTTMVGQMDRMELLWTFMAASPAYTVFTGVAELLGGLLLTCRRTRLLGALVCIGVMANVVMLNFGYDVSVKLKSSHLLGLCLFVAAADLRRLVDFFVLGRAPQPAFRDPLLAPKWLQRGAQVLVTVLVLGFVALSLRQSYTLNRTYGILAPKPPLDGIWNVKEFVADGVVQPPLLTDQRYWRRAIFDRGVPGFSPATLRVTRLDDSLLVYRLDLDSDRHTVVLSKFDDPMWQATLTYREPALRTLVLEGLLDGRQVRITFHGLDEARLPVNQGFRWISD